MSNTLNFFVDYWADLRGDNFAFIDSREKITYKKVKEKVDFLRSFFIKNHIKKSDIIAVSGEKSIELILIYLALFSLDVSVAPLNKNVDPTDFTSLNQFYNLIKPKYILKKSIINGESNWYLYEWNEIFRFKLKLEFSINGVNENFDIQLDYGSEKNVYFNLTSGSTGDIKAVLVGSKEMIFNAVQVNKRFPMKEEDCYCCLFPAEMHPHELFVRPLISGATCLLLETADLRYFHKHLIDYKVNHILATPHSIRNLLRFCDKNTFWENTKYILAGGETVPFSLRKDFFEKTNKKLISAWGSTETTGIVLTVPESMYLDDRNILGTPLEGYEVKVSDENGELLIRGDSCISSYWNVEASTQFTEDGFFRTHDVVSINKSGLIFSKGRFDSVIKSGGKKIILYKLEEKIQKLSWVLDSAVLYSQKDMIVYIFLDITNGSNEEIFNLRVLINSEINNFSYRIIFSKIPKLPSGKIDKKELVNLINI